ncbi:hypothetical protein CANARDRAFT_27775 [[Candida] arabinofermentans NRRL YB-2248]|uniref:Uncharacterized protein n=1 Tax=[Candida] arabinofermentans NRRL YB-2248 TaxID=983967 RepID=A0A1E4T1P3_9ASCO|nr:hypothetical protein CANARDRAFT_27775 [[Candida] arabinofermentans NRRL YB-2248]
MVSKLTFKGDSKKKKKRSHPKDEDDEKRKRKQQSSTESVQNNRDLDGANLFYINNNLINIEEVDRNLLESGWTTASSPTDITGPILILCERAGKIGCLSCFNDDKFVISKEDSLSITNPDEVLNFTIPDENLKVDTEAKIQRLEPTLTIQVLTVVNIDYYINLNANIESKIQTNKQLKRIALKTPDGKYVSFNPDSNELTTSDVLTENEIFNLKINTTAKENCLTFEISIGRSDSKHKLIVTNNFDIKIIEDEDDLLDDLNQFVIRLQTKNSTTGKRALLYLDELEKNRGLAYDNSRDNELLDSSVKDLIKNGIKVNNSLLNKLKQSIERGDLNEYLIVLKEKTKTDRRA